MKKWIRSVRKIRHFYRKKYRIVITAVLIVGIVGGIALRAARPVPGGMGGGYGGRADGGGGKTDHYEFHYR